jgi:hypothetical protein
MKQVTFYVLGTGSSPNTGHSIPSRNYLTFESSRMNPACVIYVPAFRENMYVLFVLRKSFRMGCLRTFLGEEMYILFALLKPFQMRCIPTDAKPDLIYIPCDYLCDVEMSLTSPRQSSIGHIIY